MTWTTTPPTEPGCYWLKANHGASPEVVDVCTWYGSSGPAVLYVYWCGREDGARLEDVSAWAAWCGPLVPPGDGP